MKYLGFEKRSWQLGLPDDRHERSDPKLRMVRKGDCNGAVLCFLLHDDVAAFPPHFQESVARENGAHLLTRENLQPTQPLPRVA